MSLYHKEINPSEVPVKNRSFNEFSLSQNRPFVYYLEAISTLLLRVVVQLDDEAHCPFDSGPFEIKQLEGAVYGFCEIEKCNVLILANQIDL